MKEKHRKITIGIVVSGITDDANKSVYLGAKRAAKSEDVNLVVIPGKYLDRDLSDNREILYEYQYNTLFYYAKPENVDGLIVAADFVGCLTTRDRVMKLMKKYSKIPCVLAASQIEGYVGVNFDNPPGIEEAMRYLIEKAGCTKFGMIGGTKGNTDADERKRAFIENLEKYGIQFRDEMFVEGNLSKNSQAKAAKLLDDNPGLEAVFCVNDVTAIGLYEELKKRNLQPGRDISVFGYDDTPEAMLADPPLSSIRADMTEVGAEAFRLLMQMLNGVEVHSRLIPTKFIRRNSFVRVDEGGSSGHKTINLDNAFDEIFYGNRYDSNIEKMKALKDSFMALSTKLLDLSEQEDVEIDKYLPFTHLVDDFLEKDAVRYADVDNLLVFLEEVFRRLKNKQKQDSNRMNLQALFLVVYRKIILAMNRQAGIAREAEGRTNYFMKLCIRDMLQFEKGNDQSYAFLLGNLDWVDIRNAYIYTFEKPIMHLYKETFTVPKTLYLKSYLSDGKAYAVPAIEQKLSISDIFHNRFMRDEDRYNFVLMPLFSNEMLYGLILCDLTSSLFVNGEFLVYQMGSAAKVITLLRTNEEIQQQLEESLATLHANNIALDTLSKSDGLTGILNRRGFYDAAQKLIDRNKLCGTSVLAVYVDMNNLKIINDRYGHEDGDFSLKLISDILVESVEGIGVAGRIGGDEFACLIEYDNEDDYDGKLMLQSIYDRFDKFNLGSDKEYNVTVSAGAYLMKADDTLSLADALTQADEKLYEVKQLRKKEVVKKRE